MLSLVDPIRAPRLCDGISRRAWLRMGALAPWAASAAHANPKSGKARSVIYLFHLGGPARNGG